MIEVINLHYAYVSAAPVFQGFNLKIKRGEAWTVIGPSGCGKTTLLYLLAGLLHPVHGSISITGFSVERPRPRTGLVLQDHGLLPWATVGENARLGLKIWQYYGPDGRHAPLDAILDKGQIDERVNYWLKWLGIDHLQEKYPSQLSRGQRQRTAIARTLALEPDLLLMDEPFSALDAPIRVELQKIMVNFHRKTILTSVIVTHDIEEAVYLGRRILVLCGACNNDSCIIENDRTAGSDDRDHPAFRQRCEEIRMLMRERS
jgi:NitT/TauT family transport system ATP-binding protein